MRVCLERSFPRHVLRSIVVPQRIIAYADSAIAIVPDSQKISCRAVAFLVKSPAGYLRRCQHRRVRSIYFRASATEIRILTSDTQRIYLFAPRRCCPPFPLPLRPFAPSDWLWTSLKPFFFHELLGARSVLGVLPDTVIFASEHFF